MRNRRCRGPKNSTRWRLAAASAYSSACTQPAAAVIGKKLSAALVFTDEHGLPLVLHAGSIVSYRDVALLSRGRVVTSHRKCIVTAMARDAAMRGIFN